MTLRSEYINFIKSDEISSELDFSDDLFDLIISYSDLKSVLLWVSKIEYAENCDILIVSSNFFTYSSNSNKKYFSERRLRMSLLMDVKKLFGNFNLERYYPFPNIHAPQMILTSKGISNLYFRYWSWRSRRISVMSKIIEYIILKGFKSASFSPHMIVKLSKGYE